MTRTGITDAGLNKLREVAILKLLDLNPTRTTAAGIEKLQEALPNLMLRRSEMSPL